MRIRWKLLILLLAISVVPMLVMRYNGHTLIRELGTELGVQMRVTLMEQSTATLKRLVSDHARVLSRERELILLALQVQKSELEKRFAGSRTGDPAAEWSEGISPDRPRTPLPQMYCRQNRDGACHPFSVDYDRQTMIHLSTEAEAAGPVADSPLASMIPVYRSLREIHPGLFLWQITILEDGLLSIYPAVEDFSRHDARKSRWYTAAVSTGTALWTLPFLDPRTHKLTFVASAPVRNQEGVVIGVTAIVVPITAILQDNDSIRMLSGHAESLIVAPEPLPDSGDTGIRILASEAQPVRQHRGWRFVSEIQWFEIGDGAQTENIIADLQAGRTGVREARYKGHQCLMAYSTISSRGTALVLIVPKADLLAQAVSMEEYVRDRFAQRLRLTGLILIGIILALIILALFLSRYVTGNIQKLVDASSRLAEGDFSVRVRIRARDEVGRLGRVFNTMIPALEDRMQMKQGLELARNVQQSLLPRELPHIGGLDVAARSIYCDETGGDFYDFIPVRRNGTDGIGVAIGDVAGHGISTALLMASCRALLRCRVEQPGDMAEMLTDVNRLICNDTEATGHFMTLFYMEIIPRNRTVSWIRAGHDPALLYDPETDTFTELKGSGMALGIEPEADYPGEQLKQIRPGQVLVNGTDGVWEARNPHDEMFGRDRLRELVRGHAHEPAEKILDHVFEEMAKFRAFAPRGDDMTLVIVKVAENGKTPES